MARSIAEINIRIGARIDKMVKGLKKAERRLRYSGRKLAALGSEISVAISAPLALAGAGALKTAADFDRLRSGIITTMKDAGASTEQARAEIEALRKEALKPGLNFEQALKGSIRLQAVGLEAATARKALANFGNAITLAGGTAADLDGVTLALTQIISKGKISAEEINQLAERVPQIRRVLNEAFGTSDSEQLQKIGIDAEQFVKKVVDEFGKLPRATGGLSNAIENTGAAIKNFLDSVGQDINKTFNVEANAQRFAAFLERAAAGFSSLSDSSKSAILGTAGALIALGPAIKVYGVLKQTAAQTIEVVKGSLKTFKSLSGRVLVAADAFKKLSLAQKATIIGLGVAAIGGAILIWKKYSESVNKARAARELVNNVNNEAKKSIIQERLQVESLLEVITKSNAKRSEQIEALQKLKSINSEYFGDLKLEKGQVKGLSEAYKEYVGNLIKSARAKAAVQKIVELEQQLLDLQDEALSLGSKNFFDVITEDFDGLVTSLFTGKDKMTQINEEAAKIRGQIKELNKLAGDSSFADAFNFGGSVNAPKIKSSGEKIKIAVIPDADFTEFEQSIFQNPSFQKIKEGLTDNVLNIPPPPTSKYTEFAEEIEKIETRTRLFGDAIDPLQEKINLTQSAIQNAIDNGMSPMSDFVQKLVGDFEQLSEAQQKQQEFADRVAAITEVVTSTLSQPFQDLFQTLADGSGNAFKAFGESLKKMIKQLAVAAGKALALQLIITAITGGTGGGFLKGFSALFAQSGGFSIPGFANGTNFAPGGLALVGERGPELVNLPRGSQVIPNHRLGSMGNTNVNVTVGGQFRMSRGDMVLFIEEAMRYAGRTSGR